MTDIRPIIATLMVDPAAKSVFQRLRDRHYPASRVPAHVTLFRSLPGRDPDAVKARVEELCGGMTTFPVEVPGPMLLSNGVALRLEARELLSLRQRMAEEFWAHLTRHDRREFEPHMTVQHRVTRRRAQRTLGAVKGKFVPFTATAEGVALWFYDGGPWEAFAEIRFEPPAEG